jgi:hypothetical protein
VTDAEARALVRATRGVAKERVDQLNQIRAALVQDDDKSALALMRVYVGIDEEQDGEESNRTSSSLD